jgi:hybrid cluster-associated redox disulfide protein
MKKSSKITKEMAIGQIIKKYPKTSFVFLDYGLHCVGCPMADKGGTETLKEAAKLHQINLEKLLKDLNKAAE